MFVRIPERLVADGHRDSRHTPHWWSELETDIEYLIFRPDPDNRLSLR